MPAEQIIKPVLLRKISCHPDAREAFLLWKDLNQQVDLSQLSNEFIAQAQWDSPLLVVKAREQKLHFVSGWAWLDEAQRRGFQKVMVVQSLIYKPQLIRERSFNYLLASQAFNLEAKTMYWQLKKLLDAIPQEYRRSALGKNYSYSSSVSLQKILQISRSAILSQINQNKQSKNKDKRNILNEILGGIK